MTDMTNCLLRSPQTPDVTRHFVVKFSYRPGEVNRCPGCSREHWHVGRSLAECAFCGFALLIAKAGYQFGSQMENPLW